MSNLVYTILRNISEFLKTKVPEEIQVLGYKAMRSFYYAVEKGHYVNNLIRCMFVGHWGVGKTTLVKLLLEEDQSGITSTDGIEIHVRRCYYDKQNRWWHIQGTAYHIFSCQLRNNSGHFWSHLGLAYVPLVETIPSNKSNFLNCNVLELPRYVNFYSSIIDNSCLR